MESYGFLLFGLSSLFAVIDPLGCIPFFTGQTHGMDARAKRRVLLKALTVSFLVLALFVYFGDSVLEAFGITIDAFRIAGGVIFFGIGLDMLQSKPRRWRTGLRKAYAEDHSDEEPGHDPSITPLAIPMIAGPGSITTVMVLSAEAPARFGLGLVILAVLAILVLTGFVLWAADQVLNKIGQTGMRVVEKLMGLLVTVIAVQLILDGLHPYLVSLLDGGQG